MNEREQQVRRDKARALRYKKPVCKGFNLEDIRSELEEMNEDAGGVAWYMDSVDKTDTLLEQLLGSEDDAYEFKMSMNALSADLTQVIEDIDGVDYWIPECFDWFFAAVGDPDDLMGYDEEEGDYFGLSESWEEQQAEKTAVAHLERMTKKDIIEACRGCFRIALAFLSVRTRYDSLKTEIDILKGQNHGLVQNAKRIEELYEIIIDTNYNDHTFEQLQSARSEWSMILDGMSDETWLM